MKKTYLYMIALAAVTFGSTSFVSCSSDDDGGTSSSALTPAPTITTNGGTAVRISALGNTSYSYDSEGKLIGFYDGQDGYQYTATNDKLSFVSNNSNETVNLDIALNGQGLIAKLTYSFDAFGDNEYGEKGTGTYSFSYNSAGQLVSMSGSGSGSGVDDYDGPWSSSGSIKQTNTWTNGNLVKTLQTWNTSGNDDGYKWSGKGTVSYSVNYGDVINASKQYTYNLGMIATGDDEDVTAILAPIGYFGVGSANLPTGYEYQIKEEYSDEDEPYSNNYTKTLSYTQNADGTIASERGGELYSTAYYSYVGSSAPQALKVAKQIADNVRVTHSKLIRHHNASK